MNIFLVLGIYIILVSVAGYFLKLKKWQLLIAPVIGILLVLSGSPGLFELGLFFSAVAWGIILFICWKGASKHKAS